MMLSFYVLHLYFLIESSVFGAADLYFLEFSYGVPMVFLASENA